MSETYRPADIEPRWQAQWERSGVFCARADQHKPKYYCLIEFPYPSGYGLHVGHPRSNTAMDIIARKRRMEGYNVLFPMGWDAFGLPTENFAIKHQIHPREVTRQNIASFERQLRVLGFSFDWSRAVNTTDPSYYRWTQWIFLRMFEKGLAYKAEMPINWCSGCKVGLANEEVVDGACERCGSAVVRRVKSQWMLRITQYAQRLIDDLDQVDYIEKVKLQQRNWIGRSEGALVRFAISGGQEVTVFTTRPDTLFGATYMVLSPEHGLIDTLRGQITNWDAVAAYRQAAAQKSDFERAEIAKDKTGVPLEGITAVNPVNHEHIPVWISDYVLMSYGTGAIMAVPAHDTRDWEFARSFGLPIVEVVAGGDVQKEAYCDTQSGVMVNSGFLTGMAVEDAQKAIITDLENKGLGEKKVNYKLRDWVFSRQRYWGEPIPLVECKDCGWVAVPDDQLPVTLPEVDNFLPGEDGQSPLAQISDWIETSCPCCGGPARRETDTMPQWAGSSWYFLRYCDPNNRRALASQEALAYWTPVDWYNGGLEHTTLHLLYSRFWHKFLYDIGVVPTPEPYRKRTSHGMILGENNEKMSKSRGNVINPDDVVADIGADSFRMYEMFMGAFDQAIPWSTSGARGCRRFLDKVWRLQEMLVEDASPLLATPLHRAIKKVGEDFEKMKFNTAIATLMALVNEYNQIARITRGEFETLLLLLSPVSPHICEELWNILGHQDMICQQQWPAYDPALLVEETIEIGVQINGKLRTRIIVASDLDAAAIQKAALEDAKVAELLGGSSPRKVIVIPGRNVNIVR